MATGTRICKVCGCEYEYCHTVRRVADVFRYQDVACCPEHGQIYLAKILASRGQEDTTVTPKKNKAKFKNRDVVTEDHVEAAVDEQPANDAVHE